MSAMIRALCGPRVIDPYIRLATLIVALIITAVSITLTVGLTANTVINNLALSIASAVLLTYKRSKLTFLCFITHDSAFTEHSVKPLDPSAAEYGP